MSDGGQNLIWYAAFGSNLLATRFATYLTGGPVPHSPGGRVQRGARDRSPPRGDEPCEIPHRLFFARSSSGWGHGGVAFLDPRHDDSFPTLGRRWLITAEQFEDVFSQENGRNETIPLNLDDLSAGAQHDAIDSWYGRLIHLGDGPGGHPTLTFTCDRADRHLPERHAHISYLRVMGLGLVETHGLEPPEAAAYLSARDGNVGAVDPVGLIEDLTRWLGP